MSLLAPVLALTVSSLLCLGYVREVGTKFAIGLPVGE